MSIRQILQVWEHEFSHPHQAIMLALADHSHEDGTGIRPSINRIAWKTGYSERSVQNIMGQLRDLGILVVVVPATHSSPNEYCFDWSVATPKPSFDEFISQKKGRKSRGADSAPLSKGHDRGAVPVQEGCSSDATGVQFPCNRGAVPVQQGCSPLHPIRKEPSREPSKETKEPKTEFLKFGVVRYQEPPDEIDLSELWARNPGMAKMKLRAIAPGHKRSKMVAYGFGKWWIGPKLNDFDEFLIAACQKRKQKFNQPDSIGDAKTFINNMLKAEDWANLSLRCEEAENLRQRASSAKSVVHSVPALAAQTDLANREQAEKREAVVGLAKYKMSQGDFAKAQAIADSHQIPYAEIGLEDLSSSEKVPA